MKFREYVNEKSKITYKEFMKTYVMPHIKKNDKPFNRELFNDQLDFVYRDGLVGDKEVNNWAYPSNKYFK